jgi:hypothetical protein
MALLRLTTDERDESNVDRFDETLIIIKNSSCTVDKVTVGLPVVVVEQLLVARRLQYKQQNRSCVVIVRNKITRTSHL